MGMIVNLYMSGNDRVELTPRAFAARDEDADLLTGPMYRFVRAIMLGYWEGFSEEVTLAELEIIITGFLDSDFGESLMPVGYVFDMATKSIEFHPMEIQPADVGKKLYHVPLRFQARFL